MTFRGSRHRQHGAWASNGNLAVYIFAVLFTVWIAFQVWARFGGGPPPVGLDPMVMAALGVAVAGKSVERNAMEEQDRQQADRTEKRVDVIEGQAQTVERTEKRVDVMEDVAAEAHPDIAREHGLKDKADG